MPKTNLPDINVWLALAFESHQHHATALSWFDSLSDEVCFFCRLTQLGFLRLSTNRSVFADEALTMDGAWQAFDLFSSDFRIAYGPEPAMLIEQWRNYTQGRQFSPKVWNDAYLAAFAQKAGMRVVTFDRGFENFENLECLILK